MPSGNHKNGPLRRTAGFFKLPRSDSDRTQRIQEGIVPAESSQQGIKAQKKPGASRTVPFNSGGTQYKHVRKRSVKSAGRHGETKKTTPLGTASAVGPSQEGKGGGSAAGNEDGESLCFEKGKDSTRRPPKTWMILGSAEKQIERKGSEVEGGARKVVQRMEGLLRRDQRKSTRAEGNVHRVNLVGTLGREKTELTTTERKEK